MHRRGQHWIRVAAIAAVMAIGPLGLTACSTPTAAPGDGSTDAPAELAPINVTLSTRQADIVRIIARTQGFFDDEGLTVKFLDDVGSNASSLIVSGQADLSVASPTSALAAAAQGADTKTLWAIQGGGVGGLMIGAPDVPDLAAFKALKSCVVAALPPGPAAHGYAVLYAELNPKCTILELNDTASIVAAVLSGGADAGVSSWAGLYKTAAQSGLPVLIDPVSPEAEAVIGDISLVEGAYWGMGPNLEAKRASVEAYARAWIKARDALLKEDPETVTKWLLSDSAFAQDEPKTVRAIVEAYSQKFNAFFEGTISQKQWNNDLEFDEQFEALPDFDASNPLYAYDLRVDGSYWAAAKK